jgi:hypothetical protein
MSTGKKYFWNARNISLGVVGLFLIMAFAGINFFPDTEGSEATVSAPIAADIRLEGEVDYYQGDRPTQLFEGSAQYDRLGTTVAAGDFNGDGFDDYIMAAYGASSYAGAVYVFYGVVNVKAIYDTSDANVTITATGRSYMGYGMTTGDFNGDGIDDILVGSYMVNSYRGEAYIFFGSTSWGAKVSVSTSKADVTFKGGGGYRPTSIYFGITVAAGDIDGDGYDEAIIYAPYYQYTSTSYYCGGAFMWWGRSTASWSKSYDCANSQWDTYIYLRTTDKLQISIWIDGVLRLFETR